MPASMIYYLQRTLHIPPQRLPAKIGRFVARHLDRWANEAMARLGLGQIDNKELARALTEGVELASLARQAKSSLESCFFIRQGDCPDLLRILTRTTNDPVADLIVSEAERICDHVFDLLGSGPTCLRAKIDWHADFKTGYRWNPITYYQRIRPAPYPGGYDIKVPWELSRCQHFVRLGQAYWITGDEKYASEFVAQIDDWIASNPWPYGVNWACTMDVAIRVVNWLWGLAFFQHSSSLSEIFWVVVVRSLLVHGRHIMDNLEGSRESRHTSNHYLADLIGLVYLGVCCPYLKEAQSWLEFGTSELWNEMFKQVYPDGINYEGSIPYHRLVTEILLTNLLLCRRNGLAVSQRVIDRLEKMLEFVYYYTKPDGTVPIIGDQDNGRLHRLAVWADPDREWVDHRYLLALGAVIFERADFAQAAGDQWQETVWLLGGKLPSGYCALSPHLPERYCHTAAGSRAFHNGGIYILRRGDSFVSVTLGRVGTNGIGNHSHNDALALEFAVGEETFIVDPGSYIYTHDYPRRNHFRSAAAHNAPVVDGTEFHHFDAGTLFQLHKHAVCTTTAWHTLDSPTFEGECQRIGDAGLSVIHRRHLKLAHDGNLLTVYDELVGDGEHTVTLRFVFGKGIIPQQVSQQPLLILLAGPMRKVLLGLLASDPSTVILCDAERSASYGTLQTVRALQLSSTVSFPWHITWFLAVVANDSLPSFTAEDWQQVLPTIENTIAR